MVSGTEIEAVDPAEQVGTVDVTVTTPSGTSPTTSSDQFTYEGLPSITSITAVGCYDYYNYYYYDNCVDITGKNLIATISVSFDGRPS